MAKLKANKNQRRRSETQEKAAATRMRYERKDAKTERAARKGFHFMARS